MSHHHHHHHHDVPLEKGERFEAAKRVTIVGAWVNVLLSIMKIAAGIVGHSAALVADGIHSASDLVSDGVVILGMKIASKEADHDHPYGHGKFETVATLFIAILLFLVGFGIVYDAIIRLQEPDLPIPTTVALIAAALSIIGKEGLYQYTVREGRRLDAKTIIANAWHHRSDAISSIAALAGVGGAMLGWPLADPVAAVGVAFFLGKMGLEFFNDAMKELTDSSEAIDEAVREEIDQLVIGNPEVTSAHFLKARRLGPDIFVDVHVVVNPVLTVSEGHQIAERVRQTLVKEVPAITDVLVHVDPYDDQGGVVMPFFPDRNQYQRLIHRIIDSESPFTAASRVIPHYRPDGVALVLHVAAPDAMPIPEARTAADDLAALIKNRVEDVADVQVALRLTDFTHP